MMYHLNRAPELNCSTGRPLFAVLLVVVLAIFASRADAEDVNSSSDREERRLPAGPRPVRNWPVILGNAVGHTPAVADIDGDGRDEIAVSARDCRIFLLDGDGRTLPGWPRETDAWISRGPMLEDIDGDGVYEIAVVSIDGFIHLWHEDGSIVEGWPVDLEDSPTSAPIPVRTAAKEISILVSCTSSSIHLISPEGRNRSGWPKRLPNRTYPMRSDRRPTSAADLDGDGSPEILHLTSRDALLYAWDLDGTTCEGFPIDLGEQAGWGLAVDDEVSPKHIACNTRDSLFLLNTAGECRTVLSQKDGDGEFFFAPYFLSSSAAQESRPDLLLTATDDGHVYLWDLEGRLLEGWPVSLGGFIYGIPEEGERHWVHGPPLTFDMDGDGDSEIILGSDDHHLYCFDMEGQLMPGWPVVVEDYILEALTFAQLDGSGSRELLVGQYGEAIFAYHLDAAAGKDAARSGVRKDPFVYSEWTRGYYLVSISILLMIVLLFYMLRTELTEYGGPFSRSLRVVLVFFLLILVARALLFAGDLLRYRRAKDRLAGNEKTVGLVIAAEGERVRSMVDRFAAALDTCCACDLKDPLGALRSLERLADRHRLEYRFCGLLLADRTGSIIQGVGLARGWIHLSELGLRGRDTLDPVLLAGIPVFVVESSRGVSAEEDTLRLFLLSSMLNRIPNAVADSTGFSAHIRVDDRTLAWGGASARPYNSLSPWLGIVQPSWNIPVGNPSGESRMSILLTMEDFEKPPAKWFDLAAVLLLPCIYLLVAGRKRGDVNVKLGWWWIIAFGAAYIAGTVFLHHGRLSSEPVPASGRILEVFLHMAGITGIVAALRRIIISRSNRPLNFALLGSYLVVSLIPLSVMMLVGMDLFQRIQRNIIEDTINGLETRAENMVLSYMGNMGFVSDLNENAEKLLDQSAETGWFNFVENSQYLFNYDLPSAYMTLWARDRKKPDRYFTGYSYRAPRTGKLYDTRPAWTGETGIKGLFLDNGTAVVRAMKSFRRMDLETQIISHIPIDGKILQDMEERMRILPFLPRVHLEPAWLESAPDADRRIGWYLPYSSELVLQARGWKTGTQRWIVYRASFYLPGVNDLWRVVVPVILLILLPLGLSLLGAFTTFRRTARPLTRLLYGIRRVGEGDLEYRLDETGQSEIGLAARSFDGMADSLEGTIKELAEKQKVEEISELKSRFISMVSHDLKTPLSSIKGATENILEEIAGPVTERQRTYLEMIMRSSGDLQRMITDLLDLSRIESGRLALNIEMIDVMRELEDLQRSIHPLLDRENLTSRITVAAGETVVQADRTRLWQILNNILSNAIVQSPRGGTINIRIDDVPADEEGGRPMLRIAVTDEGPGVEEEEKSRLFEPFYSRPSGEGGKRGAGLGLAIVKQLVELHGGWVSLENSPQGGAMFIFTLPVV